MVSNRSHQMAKPSYNVPSFGVIKSRGVIQGIPAHLRSIVGNFGARLQSHFLEVIFIFTSPYEQPQANTFIQLLTHTGMAGANSVVGGRYYATEITPGITEMLCYGTAVFV